MGFLKDLRSQNKVTDFAINAARQGGTFETNCAPDELLAWLKARGDQITEEGPNFVSVRPMTRDGIARPEVVTFQISPGQRMATQVRITIASNAAPGPPDPPWPMLPIQSLATKVSKADPQWQTS